MNVVPSHTHGMTTGAASSDSGTTGNQSVDHTHTFSGTSTSNGAHTHVINVYSVPGGYAQGNYVNYNENMMGKVVTDSSGAHTHTVSGTTSGMSASHTHSFSLPHTHSGTTDNGSSQTNWTPKYIDMILCSKD